MLHRSLLTGESFLEQRAFELEFDWCPACLRTLPLVCCLCVEFGSVPVQATTGVWTTSSSARTRNASRCPGTATVTATAPTAATRTRTAAPRRPAGQASSSVPTVDVCPPAMCATPRTTAGTILTSRMKLAVCGHFALCFVSYPVRPGRLQMRTQCTV